MLSLPPAVRVLVCTAATDMRKSFDGLCALVQSVLGQGPFSGHLFVFLNRRRDEVQDRSRSPSYPKGHVWVYRGADGSAFYDFTWQRTSEGTLRLLAGYQGYLQADAAPAYDEVYATRPILSSIRQYLEQIAITALPKSPLGDAIGYALRQ